MKEKHCVLNDLFEEMMSVKTSIIPIITDEDEEFLLSKDNLPEEMPLLPLRGNVLLPGAILPITAGRKKSIKLIKRAQKSGNTIAVFAQRTEINYE